LRENGICRERHEEFDVIAAASAKESCPILKSARIFVQMLDKTSADEALPAFKAMFGLET
jgi:hypothetical protein